MSTRLLTASGEATRSGEASPFPMGLTADEWQAGQVGGELDGAIIAIACPPRGQRPDLDRFFNYLLAEGIRRLPIGWAKRIDDYGRRGGIRSDRWRACPDCGLIFEVDARDRQRRRCEECAQRDKAGARRRPLPAIQCPRCWLVFTPG